VRHANFCDSATTHNYGDSALCSRGPSRAARLSALSPSSCHRHSNHILEGAKTLPHQSMIRKAGCRFSSRQTRSVCAGIMLKQKEASRSSDRCDRGRPASASNRANGNLSPSLRGALATKQSSLSSWPLDCFAEPVIGRAFARPGGSQ